MFCHINCHCFQSVAVQQTDGAQLMCMWHITLLADLEKQEEKRKQNTTLSFSLSLETSWWEHLKTVKSPFNISQHNYQFEDALEKKKKSRSWSAWLKGWKEGGILIYFMLSSVYLNDGSLRILEEALTYLKRIHLIDTMSDDTSKSFWLIRLIHVTLQLLASCLFSITVNDFVRKIGESLQINSPRSTLSLIQTAV